MAKMRVTDRDGIEHEIEGQLGMKLMETLREYDYGVTAICGGLCSCATCHVFVDPEWIPRLPAPQGDEKELLVELQHYDPARSRLLLAPDAGDSGALSLRDLPFRDLRAGLVVLAACRSAAGPVSRTEGAFSLGRPFMAAGVPNVVGSLWDVDDEASRTFFVPFHRSLLAGADPARALQATQLSLLHSGDPTLAHPSTWAGFVSLGALRTPAR